MRTFLLLFVLATLYTVCHTKAVDPFAFGSINSTTTGPQLKINPVLTISNKALYAFGGASQNGSLGTDPYLWIFDIAASKWNKTDLQFNHTGYSATQREEMAYIVGGTLDNEVSVTSYNMTENKIVDQWNSTNFNFTEYTSSVLYSNPNGSWWLVAFGGSFGIQCTNEIRILDVKSITNGWQVLNLTNQTLPSPRSGASVVLNGDEMIIFGGACNKIPAVNSTTVWRFNLTTLTWNSDTNSTDSKEGPESMQLQISALVDEDTIVAYGGVNVTTQEPSNQTWTYSLKHKNWTNVENVTAPNAISGQSGVYGSRRFLIYGGQNSSTIIQLIPEYTCAKLSHSCGRCILAGNCGYCRGSNGTVCVAGDGDKPYLGETCEYNYTIDLNTCKANPENPSWLVPVTITVLILIFVEVVATCVVDYRKTKSQVYIPIQ